MQGAIDVVCLAAPSLTMDRCSTIRAANGLPPGAASDCWVAGRDALYAGNYLTAELVGNVSVLPSPIVPNTDNSAAARGAMGNTALLAAALVGIFASLMH